MTMHPDERPPMPGAPLPRPTVDRAPVIEPLDGHAPTLAPIRSNGRRRASLALVAAVGILAISAVGAFAFGGSRPAGTDAALTSAVTGSTSGTDANAGAGAGSWMSGAAVQACDTMLGAFASGLGKSVPEVEAAAKTAVLSTIDREVAAGRLSASFAATLKARISAFNGSLCSLLPFARAGLGEMNENGGMRAGALRAIRGDVVSAAAKALGTTSAALVSEVAALPSGSTVCTLAAAHRVTCSTAEATFRADLAADLSAQVSAGTIGRTTADRVLAAVDAWLAAGGHIPTGLHRLAGLGMGPGAGGWGHWMAGSGHPSTDDSSGTATN